MPPKKDKKTKKPAPKPKAKSKTNSQPDRAKSGQARAGPAPPMAGPHKAHSGPINAHPAAAAAVAPAPAWGRGPVAPVVLHQGGEARAWGVVPRGGAAAAGSAGGRTARPAGAVSFRSGSSTAIPSSGSGSGALPGDEGRF
jgi:hypothetical protein